MILNDYTNGVAVDEIVATYEVSRGTVLRLARAAGLPKRPKHFPSRIRARVARAYRWGISVASIARRWNVSPAYVSTVARQEDMLRREFKAGDGDQIGWLTGENKWRRTNHRQS